MRNKLLALILVCCMLLSTIPGAVTAASQSPTQSNLDEILDNYHQKAIETRYFQNDSPNARSIENGESLEEETVALLIDAGYEAYHVTSENYINLESALNTDFATLGMDPNGSYLVAIGTSASASSGSRAGGNIDQEAGDDEGGSVNGTITHTQGGVTYTMREIVITTTSEPSLGTYVLYNLNEIRNISGYTGDMLDVLHTAKITAMCQGTPNSETYPLLATWAENSYYSASFFADWSLLFNVNWTRKYLQVLDSERELWCTAQYSSMVRVLLGVSGKVFNKKTKTDEIISGVNIIDYFYSPYYLNTSTRYSLAVQGYIQDATYADFTGDISFSFQTATGVPIMPNGTYVVTHDEPLGYYVQEYEPA